MQKKTTENEFATWVKTRLKAVGSSQKALAEALARTPSNVNKILAGEHRLDPWTAPIWARVLEVPQEEFERRAGLRSDIGATTGAEPDVAMPTPLAPPPAPSDEQRHWQAEVMTALSSIATLPAMPPGAFARLVKSETDVLLETAADDATRHRLLDHAVEVLTLYLRAALSDNPKN